MAEARVFDFKIQAKPSGTVGFRILKASFGDGYVQRGADGINAITRSYQVSMISANGCGVTSNMVLEAKKFLEDHKGYIPFLYKPVGETVAFRFVASGYQLTHEGGDVYKLTTTFEESHAP